MSYKLFIRLIFCSKSVWLWNIEEGHYSYGFCKIFFQILWFFLIASMKKVNIIIILFKFKKYECSQMYEHQLINDYNHKLW